MHLKLRNRGKISRGNKKSRNKKSRELIVAQNQKTKSRGSIKSRSRAILLALKYMNFCGSQFKWIIIFCQSNWNLRLINELFQNLINTWSVHPKAKSWMTAFSPTTGQLIARLSPNLNLRTYAAIHRIPSPKTNKRNCLGRSLTSTEVLLGLI